MSMDYESGMRTNSTKEDRWHMRRRIHVIGGGGYMSMDDESGMRTNSTNSARRTMHKGPKMGKSCR